MRYALWNGWVYELTATGTAKRRICNYRGWMWTDAYRNGAHLERPAVSPLPTTPGGMKAINKDYQP